MQDLRVLSELQRFLLKSEWVISTELLIHSWSTAALGCEWLNRRSTFDDLNRQDLTDYAEMAHQDFFKLSHEHGCVILQMESADPANKLARACVMLLLDAVQKLKAKAAREEIAALIITGNERFFSAGADLNEISRLDAAQAFEFARTGQALMRSVDQFPVPVFAAIRGYCMGGGMDLALACDYRVAAPNAVFGHRGASLGVMTGWGGTQRLPRLVGKARALEMFITAEMVPAAEALRIGLVNAIAQDPIAHAQRLVANTIHNQAFT